MHSKNLLPRAFFHCISSRYGLSLFCAMAAERTKFKKRKLMVFDDDLEVICARTNKTILKFSPRTSNIDEKGQKQLDKERGRDDNGVLIGPEEGETSPDEFTGLTG